MPINGPGDANITVINDIAGSNDIAEVFMIVNTQIYDGYLFMILLWVLWLILYFASQKMQNQPLNNAMYSSAALSVLALILRAINMDYNGTNIGLISDVQVWIFPVITALLATIVWASKDR